MQKRDPFLVIGLTVAVFVLAIVVASWPGGLQDKVIVHFPATGDFPNDIEGTAMVELSLPDAFQVDGKEADYLIFVDSEVIPDLKVGYDTKQKKIFGGLPALWSQEVDLLNGQRHQVAYTFNREKSTQVLYLDGQVIAEGKFVGKSRDLPVAYAIKEKTTLLEGSGVSVSFR